jgi:hypothetical protein
MATKVERLQSVLQTLRNNDANVVTNAEVRKVADAFAFTFQREDLLKLTNAQKAGVALREIKRWVRAITRDAIVSQAAAAAGQAAAVDADVNLGDDEVNGV